MRRYVGLGTTYDLFVNVQLATSWLHGKFLHDSLFGNYLSVHTYFLSPLLAPLAYPFGAPGLLFAAGLAVAFGVVAMVKILRLFGVSGVAAPVFATVATLMPLSLQVYQVDFYGFQMELLIPSLALWLAYFLVQRRWMGSLLLGLALQAVKENAVLILLPVVATVLCEDFIRSWGAGSFRDWRKTWNAPALMVGLASVLITPLLLHIVQSQSEVTEAAMSGIRKVRTIDQFPVTGLGSLAAYVAGNLHAWLRSDPVSQWLVAVVAGTFGLIVLRPHLLAVGMLTTLTTWLVQGELMWAPRFAPTLAFMQLAGCLGFASVWGLFNKLRSQPATRGAWAGRALVVAATLFVGLGLFQQYRLAPRTSEIYRLAPALAISPADRRKADELFALYRHEAGPEDPVIASEYLYRYIHDRNFFWYHRLRGRPQPAWILWDKHDVSLSALWTILRAHGLGDVDDYRLFAENGRFLIYRRKSVQETAEEQRAGPPPVLGESHGLVRMKVKIADGRAGLAEPLLSIGPARGGALFFFRYLDDHHLVLGMETMGESVYTSKPITFDTDRTYELELFSGSLMEAAEAGEPPAKAARRLEYQNLVFARFDGREVMRFVAPQPGATPDQVIASVNAVRAGSAGPKFLGTISEVLRTGLPEEFADGEGMSSYGPARLVVRLPGSPAGVPEPLVVTGKPGEASLGYIRVLPDNQIRVGVEFWGRGAFESEPMAVKDPGQVEIIYAFPALFPPPNDDSWGAVSKDKQGRRLSRYRVTVDGKVALEGGLAVATPRSAEVFFGKNPVGGSWVGEVFTGKILQVTRASLEWPMIFATDLPRSAALRQPAPGAAPAEPAIYQEH